MTIKQSLLNNLSLFYIYLPILIFLFGWCAWYVAIPCALVSLAVLYAMLRNFNANNDEALQIGKYTFVVILFILLILAYYLGWGRFAIQMDDYGKHNGVLNDLVMRSWPVVYNDVDGHSCMLTYYLAHYLVPALVGKIFHSYRIAELVMAIWSYIGLLFVYLHLIRSLKIVGTTRMLLVLSVLILFSPPLAIGKYVVYRFYDGLDCGGEWFWWSENLKLQYSSNWGHLLWAFPQVIVAWLTTLLFMNYVQKVEYYVPLLLPALLYGAFSFLGLIPYAIVAAVYYYVKAQDKPSYLRQLFSVYNIATSLTIGLVFIFYFWGNLVEPKPAEISFRWIDYSQNPILLPFFLITMVLLYATPIFWENRRNPWYYISVVSLLFYPLFTMGLMNDWVMRCSIPALFIMMYLILQYLLGMEWRRTRFSQLCGLFLVIILVYSTKWPIRSLQDQIREDHVTALERDKSYVTMEQFADRNNPEIRVDRRYNYFTYDMEHSFFYRYISSEAHYDTQLHLTPALPPDQRKTDSCSK